MRALPELTHTILHKHNPLAQQIKMWQLTRMLDKTFPHIVKALSGVSSESEGPIVLRVEGNFGEPLPLKLSLVAAIQVCALLLGDPRVKQAIDSGEKILPKNDATASGSSRCSFCGRSHVDVGKLVTGFDAAICDQCVAVCVGALAENTAPDGPI